MEPGAGAASCHGGTPLRPAGSHDPRQMQHPRLDALLHRRGGSSLLRRHGAGGQVRMEERPAGRLHGRRVAREARQTRAAGPRCRRGLRGSKLHVSLSPWQGGDPGGTPPSPEGTPPRAVLDWRETIMKKLVLSAIPLLAALLTSCASGGPSYRVYISNEASGDLTVIDPEKMVAMATVAIGKRARGIHASADGKQIFVALTGSPFAPPGVDESTLPPPDKSADGIGALVGRRQRALVHSGRREGRTGERHENLLAIGASVDAARAFADRDRGHGHHLFRIDHGQIARGFIADVDPVGRAAGRTGGEQRREQRDGGQDEFFHDGLSPIEHGPRRGPLWGRRGTP